MKKILSSAMALVLALILCVGCGTATPPAETTAASKPEQTPESTPTASQTPAESPDTPESSLPDATTEPSATQPNATTPAESTQNGSVNLPIDPAEASINGVEISKYTIVFGSNCSDYTVRAATYIRDEILARTGVRLNIVSDLNAPTDHEIVVGETDREISTLLDAETEGVQFSLLSDSGHVALEGDYFVIAAAAYYFVDTYVNDGKGNSDLPGEATVCDPIVKEAKNFIFLIGDGMGIYQTLLFDIMDSSTVEYSDGEDFFYGYMLPYMGLARTNSLSGVTDSAAAGTALATGYKTQNGFIGLNTMGRNVKSLTEIAGSLGMATAVMSTEPQTGATPSSFSAHANSRNDSSAILSTQSTLVDTYGTIIKCNFDHYTADNVKKIENYISSTLDTLSADEDGFFIMYEEAHIDKHCHSNDMTNTFKAVVRFNQAIAVFMEYAFYNPDTFVLITADHETGKLLPDGNGSYSYGSGDHTAHYVPVFTYGQGGELFDDRIIENIQIPKTIASFWDYEIKGTNIDKYPALTK